MIRPLLKVLIVIAVFSGICASSYAQETPGSADQEYFEALRLYEEGLYDKAEEYFNWYIASMPNSPFVEAATYYRTLARVKTDSVNTDVYAEEFIEQYPYSRRSASLLQELATRNFKADKHVEALSYFRRVLERDIDDDLAAKNYYWMAQSSAALDSLDNALDYYLKLADDYPESDWAPKALYARGRLNLENERYDASISAFELLRERYPDHEMLRRVGTVLGESYYLQGQYEEAIDALQDELHHLEGNAEAKAVYLIAESHNYLNQLDRAATYYRRYINLVDEDEARLAHYGLGWVYHKQEIYHWAAESFGNAVGEGDESLNRQALYYKAINEKLAGRSRRALEAFEEFGSRYQEGEWVETTYYEWAITAFQNNDYVKAIDVLQRLLQSEMELEQPGRVLTLLGEAYFANGEYTRSEEAFSEAEQRVDIDADLKTQAQFQRAWVQYENQAYEQAQANFQHVYENVVDHELAGEALFWSADSHYNMGNYSSAADEFARFLDRYPGHEFAGAAKYSLGWAFFKQNQFGEAVDPLLAFIEDYEPPPIQMFPYDIDTKLRLGDALYATREYSRAISYYEQVVDEERGGDYAKFQIANSYYRNNQTFEAVQNFRQLLRLFPDSGLQEQAKYNIGYIYFLTGNYGQAIQEFEEVIDLFPNSSWAARAQHNIGDAHYNANDFEEAVEAYQKVLDNYPDSEYVIEAVNGIQFSLEALGEDERATQILEDFLGRNIPAETADRLRFRQAETYFQAGDYEQAIASFRQYIRVTNVEERIPEALFNIAESYERMNEDEEAIDAYNTLINDYPDSDRVAPSLLSKAELEYRMQNYESAIDSYSRLAEMDGGLRLQALAGLGSSYLATGDETNARQAFEDGLEINSDHPANRVGMGRIHLKNDEFDEARLIFQDIANSETDEVGAEAQYRLGRVFYEMGRYSEAIQMYGRVMVLFEAHDEWVAWSLVGQAESYREQGNTSEFQNTLERVLEEYPDTEAADQAQSYLQAG